MDDAAKVVNLVDNEDVAGNRTNTQLLGYCARLVHDQALNDRLFNASTLDWGSTETT